ncbi:NERD domain-containing protein [Cytobacillus oceanisediminis]|uniref:nuclease-related domain-containing protein n=1 Tax=Cytobacillus oceanisediminis TaxID=665099 RepID=UPI001C2472E2|nr:nuclease-related domain-containing protein [Cytobacillus oceanisediminis]MBU8731021.1 NERD domain-containing protein [Cytobacillus oceanisediminis]
MINRLRFEPKELEMLRFLSRRLELPLKNENQYLYLEKGYAGEQHFDRELQDLPDSCIILNDLLLENSNTHFQIDTLLIAGGTIFIFEVKNYEGDYYIENERWYSLLSKTEIKNPLLQLQRSETLLRGLLKEFGYHLPIKSHLIFINPGFQLYQAPINIPAVFPSQLNRFLEKLKTIPNAAKSRNLKLAEQLNARCLKENPYVRIPEYTYDLLRKGIICSSCTSFLARFTQGYLTCGECGSKEKVDTAVLRSVKEFAVLFPDRKITTNTIVDWCGGIGSGKVVQRILVRNYEKKGRGKASYYQACQREEKVNGGQMD